MIRIRRDKHYPVKFDSMAWLEAVNYRGIRAERVGAITIGLETITDTHTMENVEVAKVVSIRVDEKWRREGIGTKLYEAAAKEACRKFKRPLASDRSRSSMADGFWEKQVRKGRAVCAQSREDGSCVFYRLKDCGVKDLSGLRKKRSRRAR